MTYQPEHPMRPSVTVNGRRVTVAFDVPFKAGDECITVAGYERTTVSMAPDVSIRIHQNLTAIDIHAGGAWYTASHRQMHGEREFLPDMPALLEYMLSEPKREYFEPRLASMRHQFAGQPQALARISARHVELLQAEADGLKQQIGFDLVTAAQRVTQLEAEIAKATERLTD